LKIHAEQLKYLGREILPKKARNILPLQEKHEYHARTTYVTS
jgi:hypothetical protein